MKKRILFFLLFFISFAIHAAPINKIIFFGDSLSDDGNIYKLTLHLIPKSPPYFQGRFSNGPTWAELVGSYYYHRDYVDYENYAYGGATAILHAPTTHFAAPTLLPLEVDLYLLEHLLEDKSQTLYSIWIGGNDYLFGDDYDDLELLTDKVVARITKDIQKLISYGGNNFVIMNLPNLGGVPFATQTNKVERLSKLTQLHNSKLELAVKELQKANPEVQFTYVDFYSTFADVLTNLDKYNKKYKIHIKDVQDACWQGGFFEKNRINPDLLRKEVRAAMISAGKGTESVDAITDMILKNPVLSAIYQSGIDYENGARPCDDADSYFFWDHIHPSAVIHQVIAKLVEQQLDTVILAKK